MLLGISVEQWAAILLVGATIFGPKDIPVIGRAAGRMAGKAVGFLTSARHRMEVFTERTQINELHRELQETLAQVEAIRHEVQSGVNLINPGPLTRRVLNRVSLDPDSPASHQDHPLSSSGVLNRDRVEEASYSGHRQSSDLPPKERVQISATRRWDQSQLTGFAAASVSGVGKPVTAPGLEPSPTLLQTAETPNVDAQALSDAGCPIPLPISAVSAGLVPSREDSSCTGADIVADSIVERRVALQALQFFQKAGVPLDNDHHAPNS